MIEVRDNPERSRFDISLDGAPAGFAQYVRRSGRLIFVHTEIDPAFEGKGLGSRLAEAALDAARAEGARVVPLCPFIASYIERHPVYAELVDHDLMTELGDA
jgi:predicted GNAT family acetyltransferase